MIKAFSVSRPSVKKLALQKLVFSVGAALVLSACGGSSGGDDDNNTVTFPGLSVYHLSGEAAEQVTTPWLVSISMFRNDSAPGVGTINARTLRYSDNYNVQQQIDFRLGQVELDTCEINDSDVGGGGSSSAPYVSAGPNVVINSPSGIWLNIDINEDLRYLAEDLSEPLPADATLSIPGDVFPSVGAYPLFEPVPPVRLSPAADTPIDINTEYTWEPDDDSSSFIGLVFMEFNAADEFLGFPVSCEVADDGEFELPLDILSAVTSTGNTMYVRFERAARRIDYIDGIMFHQWSRIAGSR